MMNNNMNTTMNNNVNANNKEYTVLVLVNKNGMSLLLNAKTGKYHTLTDENGSSTMASIRLLANFVSKLEKTEGKLVKIVYPKNLCGTLKYTIADEWIANGYKTEKGTELTKEYVDLVKYVNDMRLWLGSTNLIAVAGHGGLTTKNDKIAIDRAWKLIFSLTGEKAQSNNNKPVVNNKPSIPTFAKVNDDIKL